MFPYNWNKVKGKSKEWKKRIKRIRRKKAGGYKNLKFQYKKGANLNYYYVSDSKLKQF